MKGRCGFPHGSTASRAQAGLSSGLGWSRAGLPGPLCAPPASSAYTWALFPFVLLLITRCCASGQVDLPLLLGAAGQG